MLRWVLAVIGVLYGVWLLLKREWWLRFFARIDNRDREIPRWFPTVLALAAFAWSGIVLLIV